MSELENYEVDVLDEDTSNASTIATNPTVSRSELMAMMVNYANSIGNKEELAAFVAKLPTAANIQPDTPDSRYQSTQNAAGNDAKNKAGIKSSGAHSDPMAALPSMKEDLAVLFGEDSNLSEDFRTKTETLFEAAVATRVGIELSSIQEDFDNRLEEEVVALKEEMEENIDAYLNYAVAQWMEDNKLAVESNIRTEVAESFLAGLKDLFTEHYIEIPEDDIPVVESMAAKIAELEEALNEQTEKNIELHQTIAEAEVNEAVAEMSEGMTEVQKDKFVKLVESTSYTSAEEFRKKASVIKETYFSNKSEGRYAKQDQLLSESVDEPEATNSARNLDPDMQVYVSSLSRSIKK
jgi:DNA-binding FadR family transcriptional regulator